jgi:hypothetical protein
MSMISGPASRLDEASLENVVKLPHLDAIKSDGVIVELLTPVFFLQKQAAAGKSGAERGRVDVFRDCNH